MHWTPVLTELRVRDLGVIADLGLEFEPGMTVLTGETGAGKTLLVQALQLVLGGRAGPGIVRAGAPEALVEARFVAQDLDGEDTVLARSVAAGGRSRAWIDGRMAPLAALSESGALLVDIHGQHEHQSLGRPAAQRALLDRFAASDLTPLEGARAALAAVERELAALGGDERDRARRADLLRYQAEEIEGAALTGPDEDDALREEEDRLADASALREAAGRALAALEDDTPGAEGASERLGAAINALGGRAPLAHEAGRLRAVVDDVSAVVADLRGVVESWEDDPVRLEAVQARRRLLADLRRKYGDSLAEVATYGADARAELDRLAHQEEVAATLEERRSAARAALGAAEAALRAQRAAAAPRLAAAVAARLHDLAMPGARLEVAVGEEGAGDAVTLCLGANRGEPLHPLARVASGGELARAMLALHLVVGGGAPTMLFDEVDAGVGGTAALALARSLAEVAVRRQVLVVTHLPQVAAFADHHVAVRKALTGDDRTVTTAEPLTPDGRVVELSRMLSGHPDSATARAHAEELLDGARRSRRSTIPAGRTD